tara:strand:- start:2466 stop:3122 length:657 start_codon:yes stop_codon:yes gene_type:complete
MTEQIGTASIEAAPAADEPTIVDVTESMYPEDTIETDEPAETEDTAETEEAAEDTAETEEPAEIDEDYVNLERPENVSAEEMKAAVDEMLPLLGKLLLNREDAQLLVDARFELMAADAKRQSEQWDTQVKDWEKQTKSDREIGGDKFPESAALVKLAIDKLGNEEVNSIFKDAGLLAQPDVFKFFHKLGKLVQEDNPGSNGGNASEKMDTVSALYPND